jgi:putative transposase
MTRPLRIEFAGALYHVTARGNARAAIVKQDSDRELWPETLGQVVGRFNWLCHACCLMYFKTLPLLLLHGDLLSVS